MNKAFIADYELYIPENFMDYKEISALTNLPDWVIKDKFGILKKPIERNLSVSDMAKLASERLMKRNKEKNIDLLAYAASDFKDKYIWNVAPAVLAHLGVKNSYGVDISMQCVSSIVALDLIKPKLLTSKKPFNALIVMSTKQSLIVNYNDRSSSFMYDFSDGAGAVLLSNEDGRYQLLEGSIITDGSYSDVVYQLLGERYYDEKAPKSYFLHVQRSEEFDKNFESISFQNFIKIINDALEKSNLSVRDISYLALLHVKRSFHKKILNALELSEDKSIYLEEFGHMQSLDPFLSLRLAELKNKIKEGDIAVLVSAGTGWTWGAYVIQRTSCCVE